MAEKEAPTPGGIMNAEETEQVTTKENNRKGSAIQESAPSQLDSTYGSLASGSLSQSHERSAPSQLDSAYGSLASASLSQSRKSYNGSKSLLSGSSHSSGLGDRHIEFRGPDKDVRIKEIKKKPAEKNVVKELKEQLKEKVKANDPVENIEAGPPKEDKEPEANKTSNAEPKENPSYSNSADVDLGICDQPTLVYTQALNYIRKIKERSAEQGLPFASPDLVQLPRDTQQVATFLKSLKSLRGFTVAISIQDGTVLQVSPSITEVLGFPKDMLLGQSFIDFVYPKDSISFSSKIIHGLNGPYINESIKDNYGTTLFCRMRMYHSLRNCGFGVRNKRTYYKPCKMVLKFHDDMSSVENENTNNGQQNSSMILAEVLPIDSVYKYPGEMPAMGSFSIRHSASCNFSDYDVEAIPYLGYLPQDLTGNSVFDCYHPKDLPHLKTIYEEIVRQQGKPHRSKPYRFRAFNGSYVTLETEWLCFVNPWTKKIDSIIGQHRVIKGPDDIRIFLDPGERSHFPLSDEVMKEAKKAQNEIVELLGKPVASYRDPSKGPAERRRRTLARMMSTIVDELDHMEKAKSNIIHIPTASKTMVIPTKIQRNVPTQPSNISKGQESLISSSGTPSSYGQLNYSETIHRYFRSNPKTVSSDESGDSKNGVSPQESLYGTKSSTQPLFSTSGASGSRGASGSGNMKSQQSQQFSSCSGSGDTSNSRKQNRYSVGSDTLGSNSRKSYHHVQLTEEILNRHNVDMQKQFVQKQRSHKYSKDRFKNKAKKQLERSRGLKRSGTVLERESSAPKKIYLTSSAEDSGHGNVIKTNSSVVRSRERTTSFQSYCGGNGGPSGSGAAASSSSGLAANFSHNIMGNMPGYYHITTGPSNTNLNINIGNIPVASPNTVFLQPSQQSYQPSQQSYLQPQGLMPGMPLPYMGAFPGVVYQTMAPPIFNAPPLMLPNMVFRQTVVPQPVSAGHMAYPMTSEEDKTAPTDSEHEHMDSSHIPRNRLMSSGKPTNALHQRPDSRATSVKAEPGSAKGSMVSVPGIIINRHSHAAESIRSYVEDVATVYVPKESIEKLSHSSRLSQFSQSSSVQAEIESVGSPEKIDKPIDEIHNSDMIMSVTSSTNESSGDYYKSTDDSFPLLTSTNNSENSDGYAHNKWNTPRSKCKPPKLSGPSWLEDVNVTPHLLYKYQLETKDIVDVLRRDMDALKKLRQPACVDDQLSFLYNELEREGGSPNIHLEEGMTSSSSSSGEEGQNSDKESVPSTSRRRPKRKSVYFSTQAMLQEEDAPMPPPESSEPHYFINSGRVAGDSSSS